MAVTLFDSGLEITDAQAVRLDSYAVAIWLPVYVGQFGAEPSGWPSQEAHEELAEFAISRAMREAVLRWERKIARAAVTIDEW